MQMRTIFIFALSAALLSAVASGCGSDDESDEPRVVATTGIVADIAADVAGPEVEIEQLIPDGASPHDFQLSAEDRNVLEQADLVIANGTGLEAGVPLDDVDAPRWELTANVGELLAFEEAGAHEEEHAAEEEHEGEEHEGGDPHVWMDPSRVAAALPSLAAALAELDPDGAAGYERRANEYAAELGSLDEELRAAFAAIPAADGELITSHDSLGYLADRYDFEVVATAFPASGPEAEASAGQLGEVIDAISEHQVEVVFAGAEDDPEALETVADEAGVTVESGLLVESPGDAGTYEEMLRRDAELIAGALGG